MDNVLKSQKREQFWLVLLIVGVIVGFAIRSYLTEPETSAVQDRSDEQKKLAREGEAFRKKFDHFGKVAEFVKPSVVNISTKVPRRNIWGLPTGQESQGTGVILNRKGHILTNYHVVKGKNPRIQVTTSDGQVYSGKRIGYDQLLDLAIIKIDADPENIVPAKLGDSSRVKVGEWVLALGNPFGLKQSVTAGIVSAVDRGRERLPTTDRGFLQTDASINPGNSGGPLVNMKGEVIGINTMIVSRSGGSQGIGFAIPINVAENDIERMKKEGRVEWGYLGVNVVKFDKEAVQFVRRKFSGDVSTPEELAKKLGMEEPRGVLVTGLETDLPPTPAQRAGLERLDVILTYNGNPVRTPSELQSRVLNTNPGETVKLKIFRNGEKTINVKVGSR